MSITDELREWWVRKFPIMDKELNKDFTAIADRIDAEHQKALDEWKAEHGQMWLKGYAECHAELLEGNETLASDLERCGWIRLPLDADGEYICAGDVLDGYGKTIEVVELRHGRGGWVLISRDGNGYADTFAFTHHHEPTVVDTLVEFALACEDAGNSGPEVKRLAAEFAAKLRLAGDPE
jgi:hypothetical protein